MTDSNICDIIIHTFYCGSRLAIILSPLHRVISISITVTHMGQSVPLPYLSLLSTFINCLVSSNLSHFTSDFVATLFSKLMLHEYSVSCQYQISLFDPCPQSGSWSGVDQTQSLSGQTHYCKFASHAAITGINLFIG